MTVIKPHVPPEWTQYLSENSCVSRSELARWMGCSAGSGIDNLTKYCGLPPPRFGPGSKNARFANRMYRKSMWRVGDINAWLHGTQEDLEREQKKIVGGERRQERHADTARWAAHKRAIIAQQPKEGSK